MASLELFRPRCSRRCLSICVGVLALCLARGFPGPTLLMDGLSGVGMHPLEAAVVGRKCRGQHRLRFPAAGEKAALLQPEPCPAAKGALPGCPTRCSASVVKGVGRSVSVIQAFTGTTILVTGATGYLGSLVVEQVLRVVPGVRKIYLVVRSKGGMSGEQRIDKLLRRSMWHLHWENGRVTPEVRAKLEVIPGDLLAEHCGISAPQRRRLAKEVDYVIHCAASISFTEHVHTLLAHNFEATRNLARLALGFSNLRAFVHLSTAYVNSNQPRGAHVEERIYPMDFGRSSITGAPHSVESLSAELLTLSPAAATQEMERHLQRAGLPNAYMFSKRMAEAFISALCSDAFPVCIVRPSLVGCTARAPHPGYFGNNAGPTAIAIAFAIGIATFTSHQADSVFDVVPGDVCSSVILAACAAASKRDARCAPQPLVVHACTSTTNPENLYGWWDIGYRYWSADPAPLRLTLSGYPRMDDGNPPVGLSDSSWSFCFWTGLAQAKFWILSRLLRLLGQSHFATKLWNGWQAWKTYNRSALDFNLFFCSRTSQQLEAALPTDEAACLQLVWRRGQDDWTSYLHSHFDQIRYLHFRQDSYKPVLKSATGC